MSLSESHSRGDRQTDRDRDRQKQTDRAEQQFKICPGSIETFNPKFRPRGLCQRLPSRLDSYNNIYTYIFVDVFLFFWCTLCLRPNIAYTRLTAWAPVKRILRAQDSPRQVFRLGLPAGRTACSESTLNFLNQYIFLR